MTARPMTGVVSAVSGPGGKPPGLLVVHLLQRLEVGGLETLLLELLRRLPGDRFRHVVVTLAGVTPEIAARLVALPHVIHVDLGKGPGWDLPAWIRFWRLLRRLRPDLLHTLNLSALEGQFWGFLAGVPGRIHAEHGRDVTDLFWSNRKYLWLRRLLAPFIHTHVPVSEELAVWMRRKVGIPAGKIRLIENGVDTVRFSPGEGGRAHWARGFAPAGTVVVGSVGRLAAVKDQGSLIEAFALLCRWLPEAPLRLVLVGDGPLRETLEARIAVLGLTERVWITGFATAVEEYLRGMDLFVLSSLAEGTPLTLLEAMATELPVVVTAVGGCVALAKPGERGWLVAPGDVEGLARGMARYVVDEGLRRREGRAGRAYVLARHDLTRTVAEYGTLFEQGAGH